MSMIDSTLPPALQPSAPATGARGAPAPDATPTDRTIAGRYELRGELGRGGMGVVYRVHDRSTGASLALKQLLLQRDDRHTRQAAALFEREYYTLAELAHPRVIDVHDYGVDEAGPFYTMELLDGGDLRDIAPAAPTHAARLMLDICSSLALLHSRRLVHRDITPRNVRWTRDGHAKLIDFGAMVAMGPCMHAVGTPAFTAPEVLSHSALDARTDLFSLGATLYHALTGRPPFAAREFADLRRAWAVQPPPPSQLSPGVPPALDALCASLLRIDPAERPASAFEVMQRLRAACSIEGDESLAVSRAYLATPVLTGREPALRRFRRTLRSALHGVGGALCFAGAPGLGRSRMLDACALEAKMHGTIVLRASPTTVDGRPLALTRQLAEHLLQTLPDVAAEAGGRGATLTQLLENAGEAPLDDGERAQLRETAARWLSRAAEARALILAIDDIEAADPESVAMLAALAMRAPATRLVIVYAARQAPQHTSTSAGGRAVLDAHSVRIELPALSAAQTGMLLVSVFGDVPNLRALTNRLHKLALGNPRDTLLLAEHLVDHGAIRYEDGHWTLPAELSDAELPGGVHAALRARIAALPPLARKLVEMQALLGTGALRGDDYAALAPEASAAELQEAIAELLAQRLIEREAEFHNLCHRAMGEVLTGHLTPQQLRERHRALYEFHTARGETHPYLLATHLLDAGEAEGALDVMAEAGDIGDQAEGLEALLRMDRPRLANTLERCLEWSQQLRRPARQTQELRRRLLAFATIHDDRLYETHAGPWLTQLEQDSGLSDYRALDRAMDPAKRLQRALTAAMTRYAEMPECERVYPLDEALKQLGRYTAISIMVGARARDNALLATLPALLEPFAGLSPALHALWQNALATLEATRDGRRLTAAARWQRCYQRLGELGGDDLSYARPLRYAQAAAIAMGRLDQGRDTAMRWAAILDEDPQHRIIAMHVRRLACLQRGDTEAAARYEREAEVRSLQISTAELFLWPLQYDLAMAALARDLEAAKRALDGITARTARYPRWEPLRLLAEGLRRRLSGDLPAARAAYERAVAMCEPDGGGGHNPDLWVNGLAGLVSTLAGLGELDRALGLGRAGLARARALGVEVGWHALACELAQVEARHGDAQRAIERVEEVLAEQRSLDMYGLTLARSHEARARAAIWSGDREGAEHHAMLAARESGGALAIGQAPLQDLLGDARDAGMDLSLSPSQFESAVLGSASTARLTPITERVELSLRDCHDASARAQGALELLCSLAGAAGGQLYLVSADGGLQPVASRCASAPDGDAVRFARGFFDQQLDDAQMTGALTQVTHLESLPGVASYVDARGREHRIIPLNSRTGSGLVYVGLAVLALADLPEDAASILVEAPAVAAALLAAGDSPGACATDSHAA